MGKKNKVDPAFAPIAPAVRNYCEEIEFVAIVRTVNDKGQAIASRITNPHKVFRATTPDIWAFVDSEVIRMSREEAASRKKGET